MFNMEGNLKSSLSQELPALSPPEHSQPQTLPSATTDFKQVYEVMGYLERYSQISGVKGSSCFQDITANKNSNP